MGLVVNWGNRSDGTAGVAKSCEGAPSNTARSVVNVKSIQIVKR